MPTLHLKKLSGPSRLQRALLLISLLFILALSAVPTAFAVLPPPDGGYPQQNTAEGEDALFSLTSGNQNTAVGYNALYSLTAGNSNTAVGESALYSNTTAFANTAVGDLALYFNTAGKNTATGTSALYHNTTGERNTAHGYATLGQNLTGSRNTANGSDALFNNTTGQRNTATGGFALFSNTDGNFNTAEGAEALFSNTLGKFNTANGAFALYSNTTGEGNIGVGNFAGQNLTTGSNNIDIGNQGVAGESNTIRIGTTGTQKDTYVAGIYLAVVGKNLPVVVDASGHLGTKGSSARFKTAIKPMDKASEALLALKPVTFQYKQEFDSEGTPEFGLIAEQVEQVNPDLVVRDAQGKVYSVRYDAVNAMLLNEFLKQHGKVQELAATIAAQDKEIKALAAMMKTQGAQIRTRAPRSK
jgi:hypothetical protein